MLGFLRRKKCPDHYVVQYEESGFCVARFCANCEFYECQVVHGPGNECRPPPAIERQRIAGKIERAYRDRGYLGCPDCSTELLAGPAGGLCVNFACPACRARFNIGFFDGHIQFFERTGTVDDQDLGLLFGVGA